MDGHGGSNLATPVCFHNLEERMDPDPSWRMSAPHPLPDHPMNAMTYRVPPRRFSPA